MNCLWILVAFNKHVCLREIYTFERKVIHYSHGLHLENKTTRVAGRLGRAVKERVGNASNSINQWVVCISRLDIWTYLIGDKLTNKTNKTKNVLYYKRFIKGDRVGDHSNGCEGYHQALTWPEQQPIGKHHSLFSWKKQTFRNKAEHFQYMCFSQK